MTSHYTKSTNSYGVGNPGPSVAWLCKLVNGTPTDINKQYKPAQIHYHSKSPHTIIKINGNIYMSCYFPAVVCTLI
jgi:hypothetical protein